MKKTQLSAITYLLRLALVCGVTLNPQPYFAQRPIATEQTIVANLATADEEQRLALLVDLSAIFKTRLTPARPHTIAVLTNLLQTDAVPLIRTQAARALELAGDSTAVDALLAAFKTEREMTTRKTILYALASYPGPQITAALLPLLNHKEQEIRATAAYVLAEQADTAAAKPLLDLLRKRRKEADAFARSQAVRGLGRIGFQAATPLLLEALQNDKAQIVKREAAIALGWLTTEPAPTVLSALRAATSADDPYLREAAQAAIDKINNHTSL
ncbi:MAG: HEAT repeat domain-containing protein [Acidobacteria bacterium]|nr:HEAT repeat domain-containing protein [Acidobacteriota bacterium]MBI3421562.1 HEAT repeat domain-containing protein [Acidobacteriota bacterium]